MVLALARDAFFVEEVMVQCTTQGWDDTPGLPHKELMELKEELHKLYPSYWNNRLLKSSGPTAYPVSAKLVHS